MIAIDSRFEDNVASIGGALFGRDVRAVGCRFVGNAADSGGAAHFQQGAALLVNCELVGNTATLRGGALHAMDELSVVNTTAHANEAPEGGGIWIDGGSSAVTVANTILWGNHAGGAPTESDQIFLDGGSGAVLDVSYSCIQDLATLPGHDNTALDPLFVDAGSGDLHLSSGSPCVDSGRFQALPADEDDLDGDGNVLEKVPLDLDGAPRRQDDPGTPDTGPGSPPHVDMGAYERSGV